MRNQPEEVVHRSAIDDAVKERVSSLPTMPIDRPELRRVPLSEVTFRGPMVILTISVGQAMTVAHQAAYDLGGYLLELDDNEEPIAAYHRGGLR